MRIRNAVGKYGEDVAARYLVDQGLAILERNWRCELGEIDIVARDGSALVVCEVKTRRSADYGTPLDAITDIKLSRLRRLVARWLQEHPVHPESVRIDVVGVIAPSSGAAVVEHVRGVAS